MDKGIFAEVKRIEEKAEQILAEARTQHEEILRKAQEDAAAYREQSKKKFEAEQARLRREHEQKLAGESSSIEEDFKTRKARLDETSAHRTDDLADWVAGRFPEGGR